MSESLKVVRYDRQAKEKVLTPAARAECLRVVLEEALDEAVKRDVEVKDEDENADKVEEIDEDEYEN